MNSYLLTFDQTKTSREAVIAAIDAIPEITNWIFFFDNTACLVSELSASKIADAMREKLPDTLFLVVNLEKNKRSGWLRKSVWDFIKSPKSVNG